MSESQQEQGQDQEQEETSEPEVETSDGGGGRHKGNGASGFVLKQDTLKALSDAFGALQDLPAAVPANFELAYAELDGTIGDQFVTATFDEGEWSLEIEPSESGETTEEGEEEGEEEEEETSEEQGDQQT